MKDNVNLNEKSSNSQKARILSYMQSGKGITAIEALELFGCFRLGARIADLKRDGIAIESKFVRTPNGKNVKKYYLNGND